MSSVFNDKSTSYIRLQSLFDTSSLAQFFYCSMKNQSITSHAWVHLFNYVAYNHSIKDHTLKDRIEDMKVLLYVFQIKLHMTENTQELNLHLYMLSMIIINYMIALNNMIQQSNFYNNEANYSSIIDISIFLPHLQYLAYKYDMIQLTRVIVTFNKLLKENYKKYEKDNQCLYQFYFINLDNQKSSYGLISNDTNKKCSNEIISNINEITQESTLINNNSNTNIDNKNSNINNTSKSISKDNNTDSNNSNHQKELKQISYNNTMINNIHITSNSNIRSNANGNAIIQSDWRMNHNKLSNIISKQIYNSQAKFFETKFYSNDLFTLTHIGSFTLGLNQPNSELDFIYYPKTTAKQILKIDILKQLDSILPQVNLVFSSFDSTKTFLIIYKSNIPGHQSINANIFFSMEHYEICNTFLMKFFAKDTKMYQMHLFFMPLFSYFKGIEIAFLILGFFQYDYHIFSKEQIDVKYKRASTNSFYFEIFESKMFYYRLDEQKYEIAMKDSIEKLIVGFLRFFYMCYRYSFSERQTEVMDYLIDLKYLFCIKEAIAQMKAHNTGNYWNKIRNSISLLKKNNFNSYEEIRRLFSWKFYKKEEGYNPHYRAKSFKKKR